MGEAKRRKKAGTYPTGGAVEHFRVPGGKLGITVDVQGSDPSTVLFDADKIADPIAKLATLMGSKDRPDYHKLVRALADQFAAQKQNGDDLAGTGIGILWTAFNHPQHGKAMREAVSRELREKGRAHISWHLSDAGLAMTLADRFVDLENLLALAPKVSSSFAVAPMRPAEPKSN